MEITVDQTPPPLSLSDHIRNLGVGQSVLAKSSSVVSLKSLCGRISRETSEKRRFKVAEAEDGPRVWRLS